MNRPITFAPPLGRATVAENVNRALEPGLDPLTAVLLVIICSPRPLYDKLQLTTPVRTPQRVTFGGD